MMDGLVQGLGGGDEPTAETKKVKKLEGLPMEKARKLSPSPSGFLRHQLLNQNLD